MKDEHKIISSDSQRVWFDIMENTKVCNKKTKRDEVESLLQAKEFLRNKKILIGNKEYKLLVPSVLRWNDNTGIMTMNFCEGDNLESIICDEDTRKTAVVILQSMLRFVLENIFLEGFCPKKYSDK